MTTAIDTLAVWHRVVEGHDTSLLADLLADEVVFHSPVVHTPQRGKAITLRYLQGAMQVLNTADFRYVREIVGPHEALLEFVTAIDGIVINGIDLIRWGDDGRIDDFKVMVRPLKAVDALHRQMGEMLRRLSGGATVAAPSREGSSMTAAAAEFERFKTEKLALGFDEVLVREGAPGQVLETHTHPFAVQALVVRGELALTAGGRTRVLHAGDSFELARDEPHAERYGSEGATFWAARRHAAG